MKACQAHQSIPKHGQWMPMASRSEIPQGKPRPATAVNKDSLRCLRLQLGRHLRPTFHFVGIDFHKGTFLVDATEVELWSEFFFDVLSRILYVQKRWKGALQVRLRLSCIFGHFHTCKTYQKTSMTSPPLPNVLADNFNSALHHITNLWQSLRYALSQIAFQFQDKDSSLFSTNAAIHFRQGWRMFKMYRDVSRSKKVYKDVRCLRCLPTVH